MKINITLSRGKKNQNGESPIRVHISHNYTDAYIPTGIYVKENDFAGKDGKYVKNITDFDNINLQLSELLVEYRKKTGTLQSQHLAKMTATDIKKFLLSAQQALSDKPTYVEYARSRESSYKGTSLKLMIRTTDMLEQFFEGKPMFFEDITAGKLRNIDDYWSDVKGLSLNSRAIFFRNIRAIFNRAIDDGITTNYPFRKFKIKSTAKKKHELPVESLRKLAQLTFAPTENFRELARDLFMLSFYLCGANLKDIYNWKKNDYKNGKICFIRAKIKRFEPEKVEIALQPEAKALLDKYSGKDYLFSFAESYPNYETFIGNIDKRIRLLRKDIDFDELTLYYARYSWATIAYKCGVDEKTISKSLGHQDTTVAGKFYILYDWSLTDKANRKVIDYVFK